MTDAPQPLNTAARRATEGVPAYPEPALGNPASSLLESGVGNCYPGLEFDLRQLDMRFFPGLVFEFLGIEPSGPDGTQGARLVYAETESDSLFQQDLPWLHALKTTLNGPAGAALGSGTWWLHWVEQYGRRIELYDADVFQNAVWLTPYEGETVWWVVRGIEADPDDTTADLAIALSQRDANGQPSGLPVILHGKRRRYLDPDGVIPDVYRPGELTASMCSPWTHDFRDCACQYWAANHPDVVLGPVHGPEEEDHTSKLDARQAVTFLDWMRRRGPRDDVSAPPTLEQARPDQYDPLEFNMKWEELSFVLQGVETDGTPHNGPHAVPDNPYGSASDIIADLAGELAPLEFTLALAYLYAHFSLRAPEEVTADERAIWPELAGDLAAARQLVLSVALSEMTHLRWVNQILWQFDQAGLYPEGEGYTPVIRPVRLLRENGRQRPESGPDWARDPRPATPETIALFVQAERPGQPIDTEYARLVHALREAGGSYPDGLYQLAVRIDSDGLQHYQKFRDVALILGRYKANPALFLRPVQTADPDDAKVAGALALLQTITDALSEGYAAERADRMRAAESAILQSRTAMRDLMAECERLAAAGIGVPFFAPWAERDDA